jgi:hypothetical protein
MTFGRGDLLVGSDKERDGGVGSGRLGRVARLGCGVAVVALLVASGEASGRQPPTVSVRVANMDSPGCSRVRPSPLMRGAGVALPVPGCSLAAVTVGQSTAGERLVAWNDTRGTGTLEVAEWSGARNLGTPVTVERSSGDVPSAWLAFGANGDTILFWEGGSKLGDSDGWSLMAAVRAKDGRWGPVNQLTGPNNAPYESVLNTRAAPNGTIYAAWTGEGSVDDYGAHLPLHVLRWTPRQGFSKTLTLDTDVAAFYPSGSAVSAAGDLLLSWTRQGREPTTHTRQPETTIETADWPAAAPHPTPVQRLAAGTLPAAGYGAAVAFDAAGDAFATWQQTDDQFHSPISVLLSERKRGRKFATPLTLSRNDAAVSEPPSLVVNSVGGAFVTWPRSGKQVDTTGDGSARVATITVSGAVRQQEIPGPTAGLTPPQAPPQLFSSNSGTSTLFWVQIPRIWTSTCTVPAGCSVVRSTAAANIDPATLESFSAPNSNRITLTWEQGGRVAATGRVLAASIPER